ncbi:MAG: CDP-alcohol phosphatidyltransferase family protein [Nocardioidaceae bacterium]
MLRRGRRDGAGSSRAATNALLHDLAAGCWRPAAWAKFLVAAARRSVDQARVHPRALAEVTALHGLLFAVAPPSGRRWISSSWLLASTHLGLLEDRSHLVPADLLTLARGNLPAVVGARHPWVASLAMATDFVDGKLARGTGTTTPFGAYADVFADASFWIWFTTDREDGRWVRVTAAATWLLPVAAVTALSVGRGRMVDAPRPRWVRPAATLQVLLTGRALWRAQRRRT